MQADNSIVVGVVDDHPTMLDGVQAVLATADDIVVTDSAATVAGLLVSAVHLDVVILDLGLADDSSPTDNIATLRAAGLEPLVYTSGDDPYLLRQAARANVMAAVTKNAERHVLIEAVRAVAAGSPYFTAEWAAAIDGDPKLDRINLSKRHQRVLMLTAAGESASGVAKTLKLSERTVTTYLKEIRRDYATAGRPVGNTQGAYYLALKYGLVPGPAHDGEGNGVSAT